MDVVPHLCQVLAVREMMEESEAHNRVIELLRSCQRTSEAVRQAQLEGVPISRRGIYRIAENMDPLDLAVSRAQAAIAALSNEHTSTELGGFTMRNSPADDSIDARMEHMARIGFRVVRHHADGTKTETPSTKPRNS